MRIFGIIVGNAGTVSTPTFTGDSQNTEPAYYALAYIQKAA